MALSATQALQLSALLSNFSSSIAGPYSAQGRLGGALLRSAQSGIQAEAVKKAKKEQEKKSKGGLFGSIGGTLGTAAGIALAPFTGGGSLALAGLGAAGGALGSAAGQAIGGGGVSPSDVALAGVNGGFQGYTFGKSQLAQQVDNPAVNPAPSVPLESQVAKDFTGSFHYPQTMVGSPINPQGVSGVGMYGFNNTRRLVGPPKMVQMAQTSVPASRGFGNRFMGALSHTMAPRYTGGPYIQRTPDGQPDIIRDM